MFPYKQFLMRWRRTGRNGREGGAEAELEVRDFNKKEKEERRRYRQNERKLTETGRRANAFHGVCLMPVA